MEVAVEKHAKLVVVEDAEDLLRNDLEEPPPQRRELWGDAREDVSLQLAVHELQPVAGGHGGGGSSHGQVRS